jgi:Holliday junction DNA helicase RuvA
MDNRLVLTYNERMISRMTGRLERLCEGAALIDLGAGFCYEVHVPACDVVRLERLAGQDVTLHTIHYFEGDPARGNLVPRLVGFLTETDREFFRVFITVKGIGIRKALRALARPMSEIAAAILAKDVRALKDLPEIGPRMAERLVTELADKVAAYAGLATAGAGGAAGPAEKMSEAAREAVSVLVQLGERRNDAVALVERVLAVAPEVSSTESIIQAVYRLKGSGK